MESSICDSRHKQDFSNESNRTTYLEEIEIPIKLTDRSTLIPEADTTTPDNIDNSLKVIPKATDCNV